MLSIFSQEPLPQGHLLDKPWEYYYSKGLSQFKAGMYDYSFENLRNTITVNPEHYEAVNLMARICALKNERDRALDLYEKSLRIKSDQPGTLYEAALLHEVFTGEEKAIRYLTRSLELDPGDARSYAHLVRFQIRAKNREKAAEYFRISNELGAKKAAPLYEKAKGCFSKGKYDEAEKLYLEAMAASPLMLDACYELTDLYRFRKQDTRAVDLLEKLAAMKPDEHRPRVILANIYFTKKLPGRTRKFCLDRALLHINAALTLQPFDSESLRLLGDIHGFMGHDLEAKAARDRALRIEMDDTAGEGQAEDD
jgi:tetratricopeptide (TPR) repeat protein